MLQTDRLHITLHSLGDFVDTVPQTTIDAAIAALATVRSPVVDIAFDRALSFSGSGAYVLCGHDDATVTVTALVKNLSATLKRYGLRPQPSSKPHMTLLYGRKLVAEHTIEPIQWTAIEIVLALSHLGKTQHDWLVCQPLC